MKKRGTVLVVDDDDGIRSMCKELLSSNGYSCITQKDPEHIISQIQTVLPELIVLDQNFNGSCGLDVLKNIKGEFPGQNVAMFTGVGTIESAITATRLGACDYITKPIPPSDFLSRITDLVKKPSEISVFDKMIGKSPAMIMLFERIEKASKSDADVFTYGESGTGKELVARAIHENSPRYDKPFIAIDCVSLPPSQIESELFGHERGAFTGANSRRVGLLEQANGGTIFLDEITEFNIDMQPKLLRVLEERCVRRVGGRNPVTLDIRIVSATNRRPEEAITDNRLRADLFYRLNVLPLDIPPLRERSDDIIAIANHYLTNFSMKHNRKIKKFSKDALNVLRHYEWPGNIRQLKNLVEQLVVFTNQATELSMHDIPRAIRSAKKKSMELSDDLNGLTFKEARKRKMKEFELQYIKQLLEKHNGNVSKAALSAGLHRSTLYRICEGN